MIKPLQERYKTRLYQRYLLIPLLLGTFFLIFYGLYSDIKKDTIQDFNSEKLLLAKTASQGISSYFENYESYLTFISKSTDIIEMNLEGEKMMADFYVTNSFFINAITRVNEKGQISHTHPFDANVIGKDISYQKHIQEVLSTRKTVLSDVFRSVQGYLAIAIHVPVYEGGNFKGTISVLIPIDNLGRRFIKDIGGNKKGDAWLVTENLTEIYCQQKSHIGQISDSIQKGNKLSPNLIAKISDSIYGIGKSFHQIGEENNNAEELFTVFYRIPLGSTYWTILISYEEGVVYAQLTQFRIRLIIALLILFIGASIYFFSLAKVQHIVREEKKRKAAEQLLDISNERFQSFMENTPMYAYIKDESLNFIYHNKKVEELKPKDSRHPIVNARNLFDSETCEMLETADRSILNGEKESFESIFKTHANGQEIWLNDYKFAIQKTPKERWVAGAVFDITEIKKYELELEQHKDNLENLVKERTQELQMANRELGTLNEVLQSQKDELQETLDALNATQSKLYQSEKMASLGILTAGVSHEINNPLQYLAGSYYGLVNFFKKHPSADQEMTDLLLLSTQTAIDRISAIVKGLNQFSRDNSDFDEDCDLNNIIDNCLTVLKGQYNKRVEIITRFDENLKPVKGNVGKLHQVFTNLIGNAVQAIEGRGEIEIRSEVKGDQAFIEIKDSGSGISPENMKKIMDPFFTTKAPGEGTGLGLSITYSIIKEHKSEINFISEIDTGTTVILTFPYKH